MSVSNVGSRTRQVDWGAISSTSEYEVFYTTKCKTVGNGRTTSLSATLRDLTPSTSYKLELVVYELGGAVGIARLGLATNKSFLQSSHGLMTVGGITVLVALMIMIKLR